MACIDPSWPLGHIWKTKVELANHIGEPVPTVTAWFAAGRRVPPARFGQIIAAAAERGHALAWQDLDAINRRTPKQEDAA
ncbi:hypothetical protein [[Roseibacterium] beibuensis]